MVLWMIGESFPRRGNKVGSIPTSTTVTRTRAGLRDMTVNHGKHGFEFR